MFFRPQAWICLRSRKKQKIPQRKSKNKKSPYAKPVKKRERPSASESPQRGHLKHLAVDPYLGLGFYIHESSTNSGSNHPKLFPIIKLITHFKHPQSEGDLVLGPASTISACASLDWTTLRPKHEHSKHTLFNTLCIVC